MLELQYELESKAAKWYATIDIANAFFSIPLAAECRPQFAFTWRGVQYTWNRLPQGWKRSPTICHGLIQAALEKALKSLKKIAVIHVKGHQKRRDIKTRRNNLADDEAKKAALRENSNVIMTFQEAGTQNQTPYFSSAEVEAMKNLGETLKEGQWILPDEAAVQTVGLMLQGLIDPGIQGMQMTAMPIDPELIAKGKPDSLMILKARPTHTQKKEPEEMLTEHKETTVAQEMLTKFEKECEKLDAAREILEKLQAEMRESENLDYWEYRRN
ncbi:hypothetical protein DUI87_12127 [Hirundo rustica rustica]|uniref:ribonuclease H n=1 Tax=Hirundo rustica rustica TaxID=333673 RepID=A0A3M0KDG0_HIRRU|nr:hypothetical protein DUI87_12127 [Hirundo rustica rustica]